MSPEETGATPLRGHPLEVKRTEQLRSPQPERGKLEVTVLGREGHREDHRRDSRAGRPEGASNRSSP